jgi:xylulose-5-phosphate/fructose-6-phosphate phosphoketolase
MSAGDLALLDAWWRAANYLSVGQIYLLDNPLLREPLAIEHVKPRLLGHWGTTPGLNFTYVHVNRAIREHDLNAIFITGPGHGGPGLVARSRATRSRSLMAEIGAPDAAVRTLVVTAREDLEIARQVRALLRSRQATA